MKLWMAPAGLHIEPAKTKDAKILAKLHAQGFYHGWPTADFVRYLSSPHQTPAYIACNTGGKIAGFALIRLAGEEAELLTLVVERKWRGKRIGAALMSAIINDLLMTPAREMFLEVDAENAAALALYRGLGFVKIGARQAYYPKPDGSAATALVMRAALF